MSLVAGPFLPTYLLRSDANCVAAKWVVFLQSWEQVSAPLIFK